jgi:signal transduction histidine kinase
LITERFIIPRAQPVVAETELALRRPRTNEEYRLALELVLRNAQQLASTIDALVAAARHESGAARGTSDAFAVPSAAAEASSRHAAELAIDFAHPERSVRLGVDGDFAERVLRERVSLRTHRSSYDRRRLERPESSRRLYGRFRFVRKAVPLPTRRLAPAT